MAKNEFDITSLTPEQRDARLALDVERLLRFGRKHKLIKDLDILVARNTLLDLLALAAPSEAKPPKEDPETPAALLDEMVELAAQKELFDGAVNQYRINFETRLMGALMPRESEVCKKFRKLYVKQGAKAATDWFYQLCVDTNYIRTAQIAKNIFRREKVICRVSDPHLQILYHKYYGLETICPTILTEQAVFRALSK